MRVLEWLVRISLQMEFVINWEYNYSYWSIFLFLNLGRLKWCSCSGVGFRICQFHLYRDCTFSLLFRLCKTTFRACYSQPLDAIQTKAREFHTTVDYFLNDFNLPRAGNIAVRRSAALVFVSADSGENYITVDGNEGDRWVICQEKDNEWVLEVNHLVFLSKNLTAWHGGDALVLAVAAQNNNTIVIVNSVGPLIIEPWIDHPNVTAVRILFTSFFFCIF